ncbi:hypothetical protein AB6F55_01410 [Providencia hangzhouensis]
MSKSKGTISIENKWDEDFKKVEIIYQSSEDDVDKAFITYNIRAQQTHNDVFDIEYSSTGKSSWIGTVTTSSGQKWSSGSPKNVMQTKPRTAKLSLNLMNTVKKWVSYIPHKIHAIRK